MTGPPELALRRHEPTDVLRASPGKKMPMSPPRLTKIALILSTVFAACGGEVQNAAPHEPAAGAETTSSPDAGITPDSGISGSLAAGPDSGTGSAPTSVGDQHFPRAIATDDVSFYWITVDAVLRSDVSGMAPTLLHQGAAGAAFQGVGTDGTNVYWTDSGSGMAFRLPCDASPEDAPVHMTDKAYGGGTMAVYGGFVYWAVNAGSGTIYKLPVAANNERPTVVASHLGGLVAGIAANGAGLFWTINDVPSNHGGVYMCVFDRTCDATGDGGAVTTGGTAFYTKTGYAYGIAADSTHVYWTEQADTSGDTSNGSVYECTAGEACAGATPLSTHEAEPLGIALNATPLGQASGVFWTNYAGGAASGGAVRKYEGTSNTVTTVRGEQSSAVAVAATSGAPGYLAWALELPAGRVVSARQ